MQHLPGTEISVEKGEEDMGDEPMDDIDGEEPMGDMDMGPEGEEARG
jgi:hypothetical protein